MFDLVFTDANGIVHAIESGYSSAVCGLTLGVAASAPADKAGLASVSCKTCAGYIELVEESEEDFDSDF